MIKLVSLFLCNINPGASLGYSMPHSHCHATDDFAPYWIRPQKRMRQGSPLKWRTTTLDPQ